MYKINIFRITYPNGFQETQSAIDGTDIRKVLFLSTDVTVDLIGCKFITESDYIYRR
jgi:hypothetical protein